MAEKSRLDSLLVERGLAGSRDKARALIMAGAVFSGTRRLDKPGHKVAAGAAVEVRGASHDFVSRGGVKLSHAMDHFSIKVEGLVCLDIGASTGGFTDVLLREGAAKVYAVDVGHGQLAWELRNDDRVVVLERTNARHLTGDQIGQAPQIITCDASFIGLRTLLPAALGLAAPGCVLVALIKPQFEVGRGRVGKGGVVRDAALHAEVCQTIRDWLAQQSGWDVLGITESPIAGPKGNVEFLIAARKSGDSDG